TALLVPFVWMGLEYFRSELYYLKFSWLNVGYALSDFGIFSFRMFGMYGAGFLAAICAAIFLVARLGYAIIAIAFFGVWNIVLTAIPFHSSHAAPVHIAGVQMEFPAESDIPPALDSVVAQYTNTDIVVLSEYTLDGPVPDALRNWCRKNHRYLVVGGKDPDPN